jgi:site-specific DNA recombinase
MSALSVAAATQPERRFAAALRCSEEELQNPDLSLDRQLRNCEAAVARWGGRIVAVYYEVETGTADLRDRGSRSGLAGFDIPIPRAGGMPELLRDASRTPAAFNHVVAESINRLARNSLAAFQLEDHFNKAGVGLHCANEPFETSFGSIVLRHINVGLAVGYHHELMTASRQGFEAGTHQGWHMGGVACYGYKLVAHDHPNPHKRKRGLVRHTLDLDPVRAPVVRRIFDEYLYGTRGFNEIRDLLNSDPDRFPPPTPPNPARALGVWSKSSIREILHNPKYTGYQVWNRRARKQGRGRPNPPDTWVWSDQPSHPPIISKQEHQQVAAKAQHNARSRRAATTDAAKSAQSARGRTEYLFRSRLRCGICGLRMWGHRRKTSHWYGCQPSHQRGAGIPPTHPPLVYLNEQPLLDAVTRFLATNVYGPERHAYWNARLASADTPDPAAPARARARELQREVADLHARLDRQIRNLEDDDVSAEFRRRVAARVTTLEHDLAARQDTLRKLHAEIDATPSLNAAAVERLLAAMPLLADALPQLPQADLRRVFDSLDLRCVYDPAAHAVDLAITLVGSPGDDAQVWDVPPAGHNTNPNPLVTGPAIRLTARHAKTRRDGYRTTLNS